MSETEKGRKAQRPPAHPVLTLRQPAHLMHAAPGTSAAARCSLKPNFHSWLC